MKYGLSAAAGAILLLIACTPPTAPSTWPCAAGEHRWGYQRTDAAAVLVVNCESCAPADAVQELLASCASDDCLKLEQAGQVACVRRG